MASGISKPYGVTRDLSWASLAILRNTPQFHESLQRKLSPPASAIDSLPRVTYRVVEMAKSESLGHFERHCQDTPSGGLDDLLTSAEVGHDALVNLSREEAFQAADDVAFGPASGEASGDVVAGRLVELHPDDDGSIEGRVGVSVAASIEAVPTGGHPRRGRDRAGAAELREGGLRTNPVWVIAEDDQQLSRGVGAHPEALAEGR